MAKPTSLTLSPDAAAFVSAALRHIGDAEYLLAAGAGHGSPDQAFHLAGFAPECIRKGILALRWLDKAIGHGADASSADLLDFAVAIDPAGRELEGGGQSRLQPRPRLGRHPRRLPRHKPGRVTLPSGLSALSVAASAISTESLRPRSRNHPGGSEPSRRAARSNPRGTAAILRPFMEPRADAAGQLTPIPERSRRLAPPHAPPEELAGRPGTFAAERELNSRNPEFRRASTRARRTSRWFENHTAAIRLRCRRARASVAPRSTALRTLPTSGTRPPGSAGSRRSTRACGPRPPRA